MIKMALLYHMLPFRHLTDIFVQNDLQYSYSIKYKVQLWVKCIAQGSSTSKLAVVRFKPAI